MYIKIGSEFADEELSYLAEVCSMLDEKIKIDYAKIKAARDVDIDGAGDHCEYLIGLGFTAMQRYLVDVLDMSKINKNDVLKLGNKFSSEFSIAEIINHAANWWKHEPEWTMIAFDEKELTSNKTINAVLEHAEYPYALSNILGELLKEQEFCLSNVLPHLIKWRKEVDDYRSKKEKNKE